MLTPGKPSELLVPTAYGDPGPEVLCHFGDHRALVGVLSAGQSDGAIRTASRLMASLVMMTTSLTSLRTITYAFHHEVEVVSDANDLSALMTEFATDLDELYDLDLRLPGYKLAYETVKLRSGLERAVEHLKWAMQTVIERISDEQIRQSAQATVLLTAVIVVGTVAAVAAAGSWRGVGVLVIGIAAVAILARQSGVWRVLKGTVGAVGSSHRDERFK